MRLIKLIAFIIIPAAVSCQKISLPIRKNVTVKTWQTPPPPYVAQRYLFVFIGESNSGGYGNNSDASSAELAVRNKTYILNNTTYGFEALDIGTNNFIRHIGIPDPQLKHGWELQIANLVDSNYLDSTWIVKCGQGGTQYFHWASGATYTSTGGSVQPYNEALRRIDSAKSKSGIDSVIFFWSLGINDCNGNNDTSLVRPAYQTLITNLRNRYGNAPFVMTKIPNSVSNFARMNTVLQTVATNLGNIYLIETNDLSRGDSFHWNYTGLKQLARRMIDKFVEAGYSILK